MHKHTHHTEHHCNDHKGRTCPVSIEFTRDFYNKSLKWARDWCVELVGKGIEDDYSPEFALHQAIVLLGWLINEKALNTAKIDYEMYQIEDHIKNFSSWSRMKRFYREYWFVNLRRARKLRHSASTVDFKTACETDLYLADEKMLDADIIIEDWENFKTVCRYQQTENIY